MSIKAGRYFIQSLQNPSNFAGTGPVPPIWPPFPAPLRSVNGNMKDVFLVQPQGDNTYILKTHDMWVGYDDDNNIRLLRQGSQSQAWVIELDNNVGRFHLKHPDSGYHWTAGDDSFAPIGLKQGSGDATQEWQFVPYDG